MYYSLAGNAQRIELDFSYFSVYQVILLHQRLLEVHIDSNITLPMCNYFLVVDEL